MIILVPGDHMHMEMKYRLSCCFAIILHQIKSICSHSLLNLSGYFFGGYQHLGSGLIIQRKQILIMFLRKQQRMSSGCRSQIQNNSEILILIQGSGGISPFAILQKIQLQSFILNISFEFLCKF